MGIRIPALLREWRRRALAALPRARGSRRGLALWRALAARPWIYRLALGGAARLLRLVSVPDTVAGRRRVRSLGGIARGWLGARDLPAPEGETFQARWRRRQDRPRP